MLHRPSRLSRSLLLALLLTSCGDQTRPPDDHEPLTEPPDLTALVFQNVRRSGNTPAGPLAQYELWIGAPGSTAPEAGLVVGEKVPVFQRVGDELRPTTAAAIRVGALIEIWREPGAAYGSVQAPPGAPAYSARQVVLLQP